jgi:hypothetical protein
MLLSKTVRGYWLILLIIFAFASPALGQGVKRIVIIKLDGVPGYFIDKYVRVRDPKTGRSTLPWFEEVFYKNGTRVPNFYSRGMSLSGPAWGQIDTGQHLQIKGNVEFDRYTLRTYDYLGLMPFYTKAALKKAADTTAAQVLDELQIPLLSDMFPYKEQYTANQLYQRGVNWAGVGAGFINVFPRDKRDLIDEWTMGFSFRDATVDQNERDIVGKLTKRPEVDYYDYYNGAFDHVSHHNSDNASRVKALQKIDQAVGRIWTAIQSSSRADETALVVVSDHGFNSEEGVYSQGFNLVRLLGSREGGAHHVVTKRRLMLDYSLKGINPYVPIIRTQSDESYYLKGENEDYPTALLDFDGNERSSLHLRNSDLNELHILLKELRSGGHKADIRKAAIDEFFRVIDANREEWSQTSADLKDELAALHRYNLEQAKVVAALPEKSTPEDIAAGEDKKVRRIRSLYEMSVDEETSYTAYVQTLDRLLSLDRKTDLSKIKIEDVIARGAMGERNSLYEMQNYIVGEADGGLTLGEDGKLDLDKSFARVNYFDRLKRQTVRNNVQSKIGSVPIDFVATRIPLAAFAGSIREAVGMGGDPILLYGGVDKQVLLLSRTDANGTLYFKYLPVAGIAEDSDGKVRFQTKPISSGYPLKFYEDPAFAIPADARATWFAEWHSELEWLRASHRATYSDAIIALNEQMDLHELPSDEPADADAKLIRRFRERQRHLTEADLLILANNHWNFDVRGFNPGGNHGSFFRVSTNSTFMLAGGSATSIPKGLAVDEPYDSLSVMPTILALMGRIDSQNEPDAELKKLGYRKFPGRVVKEVLTR